MNLSDSQTAGQAPRPTAGQGPRRVSAMEAVLTHLRGAIERGEYAIGERLPSEAELCRTLEVSRPVLREALRALQTMGLTVSRTGRGCGCICAATARSAGASPTDRTARTAYTNSNRASR